jgi:hypothetical protein
MSGGKLWNTTDPQEDKGFLVIGKKVRKLGTTFSKTFIHRSIMKASRKQHRSLLRVK